MTDLVTDLTTATFDAALSSSPTTPLLLEFTASWCPPCQALKPLLHQLAVDHEGTLAVATVDVDAEPDLAQRYGVMAMPTLLLMTGGEVKERVVGFQSRRQLEALVSK